MTFGIPDPGQASGTFTALERTQPTLVSVDDDGVPTTTSAVVAAGTGNQHESVIRLIRDNAADFEEFGRLRFEIGPLQTAGGVQRQTVAVLGEQQATLLMTYLRNSDVVRDFKKRLVHEFYALRGAVMPSGPELLARAVQAMLATKDARIAELEPPANAYNELVAIKCDLKVADAAKILSRDERIRNIGQNRLFRYMHSINWCFRNRDTGRWCSYQSAVERRWLLEKPGEKYYDKRSGEHRAGEPVVLVTPKGLQELHKRLAGGQLALVGS